MDDARTIARAGDLAAQFADRAAERMTVSRNMTDRDIRAGASHVVSRAMPRLSASLDRLMRDSEDRSGQPPLDADGAAIEYVERRIDPVSAALARTAASRIVVRETDRPVHGAIDALNAERQAVPPSHEDGAASGRASSAGEYDSPVMPPVSSRRLPPSAAHTGISARPAPSVQSGAKQPIRAMSPSALRQHLLQSGGLGELLAQTLRERLRPHLKFDPSIARIHRNAAASSAARELSAEAFTIGPDIFFGEGRYAPENREGYGLLAHEMTHVGQQAARIGDRMHFFTPQGGDAMESEAQETAAAALASDDNEKRNRTGGAAHQASAPPRPALAYALPSPRATGGFTIPAQKATEETGQDGAKVAPAQADARAVTDRVYELMKQEIALGRERGSSRRKGY